VPDLRELVADPRRAFELSAAEAAALLIELASLQAAVAARLSTNAAASPASDRLLTAEEVAERLQRSVDWVYRQAKHWPFTRRLTRRTVRFSEAGLQRFLGQRRTFTPEVRKVSSGG
jgi:predicted DNA-binding transcriptional regulator AlpA